MKYVMCIDADKFAPARQPNNVCPIQPELSTEANGRGKKLEGAPWLPNVSLDLYLREEGQLEFLLSWGLNYEATWRPCNNVPELNRFK